MSVQKPAKNINYLRQPKKPFEMIYRQVLDKLRNPDALAVYCHLSGKPDNWEINDQYLMNHFGWGRDKTRNAVNCLIVNNLIKRIQLIDEKGKFTGRLTELQDGYNFNEYIEYSKKIHKNLCEYKQVTELSTELHPLPEKPSDGLSVDGQTAPTIEDIKAFKEEDKKNKRDSARQKREPLSDDFVFDEQNRNLCHDKKLRWKVIQEKFIAYAKAKGLKAVNWQAEAKLWIVREREELIQKKTELSSNVMEYGPGHPTWEANQEWKRKQLIKEVSHGSEIRRDNAGRTNMY